MEDTIPYTLQVKLENKGYRQKDKRYKRHIYDVLKWLRKEKNIYVIVFLADDSDKPVTYEIYNGKNMECLYHHHNNYFSLDKWDDANIEAIKYVSENLI